MYEVNCPLCKGKSRDISIALGLGREGLVPAYYMENCPKCKGRGRVWVNRVSHYKLVDKTHEEEFPIPFSIIKWLLKK